ncbi:conserved protein of unknown function [Pseudomonas marincola]|uniref:Uncharacterized protein n=1 Tax=Pseudomonas marincola TaxID=437900 RepID=A0A653DZN4_9PSED|nr:conserved protein of unknown function [Pseudomonas marincola]
MQPHLHANRAKSQKRDVNIRSVFIHYNDHLRISHMPLNHSYDPDHTWEKLLIRWPFATQTHLRTHNCCMDKHQPL